MSRDPDKIIKEHERFQEESRLRINKLLAQRDPCYESRYQDKRNLLLVQIQTLDHEIDSLEEKLGYKRKEHQKITDQLKALDGARKNWEPIL